MTTMQQPTLGLKIAELRKAKGLTQEELVLKSNINIRTLQRIESGHVTPRSFTIRCISEAMEYDPGILAYLGEEDLKSIKMDWLKNSCQKFIDLINLKNDTMKKVSMLSLATFGILVFILGTGTKNKRNQSFEDKIVGNWKQYAETKGSKVIQTLAPRLLKINPDHTFVTCTNEGSIYNSGTYYVPSDSLLITIHDNHKGEPQMTANMYNYTIHNDTLEFKGYFMRRANYNKYFAVYIDEIWVRTKEFSVNPNVKEPKIMGANNKDESCHLDPLEILKRETKL